VNIECCHCQKTEDDADLRRCKVCRNHFCEDHAVHKSGIAFCSLGCAQYFFHVDPDEEED
jgi:hypothetical protein